ncbi:MAG: tetratricopeptide repeat protein [Nostoc sp.]|uniref:tetratricopeptide repeat protein n=1 Tax=unclassified Nostoc TaxID=2593658 RepID=UPI0025CD88F5|nr:tetratricopeptide repeat protein [Nostoc sp. NMS7]MBN3951980.1 tetratricopeptide repeat protein [Nostoc sp. NMS7]
MSAESLEIAQTRYQTGKIAFENGQYRQAVENLEKASALLAANSRLGGEVEIHLVTAYEAAGRTDEAIALCQRLKRHPDFETSKQARQMLYILKAPKLKRPSEWMTEIPDLGALSENELKITVAKSTKSSVQQKPKPAQPELVDLSQVNTRDNRFIWVALIAIGLTISYLVWLSFSGTPG